MRDGARLGRRPVPGTAEDHAGTFGYHRAEILAALANGALLFGVAAMLAVAAVGLVVNLIGMYLLKAGAGEPPY